MKLKDTHNFCHVPTPGHIQGWSVKSTFLKGGWPLWVTWSFSLREIYPTFCIRYIYSISLYKYESRYLFHTLCEVYELRHLLCSCNCYRLSAMGSSFRLSPVSTLRASIHLCEHFLTFGATRICGIIMGILFSGPRINHAADELWILFWRIVLATRRVGIRIRMLVSCLLGALLLGPIS